MREIVGQKTHTTSARQFE